MLGWELGETNLVLQAYTLFISSLPPAMRSTDSSSITKGEAERLRRTIRMEPWDDFEGK